MANFDLVFLVGGFIAFCYFLGVISGKVKFPFKTVDRSYYSSQDKE